MTSARTQCSECGMPRVDIRPQDACVHCGCFAWVVVPSKAITPSDAEVRALRDSLGLSQSEIVARLPHGITLRTWQAWEQGERRCPPYAWAYVRAQLGVLKLPEKAKRK